MKVAAVQLQSADDVSANLRVCAEQVTRAANAGAEVVLLPENFAYLGAEPEKRLLAEAVPDKAAPIQSALVKLARRHRVTIVGGGMPEKSGDPEKPFNTSVAISPAGEVVARYRKVHLFDVDLPDGMSFRESSNTTPGTEPVVADLAGTPCGFSVCYDLRFPEYYRRLADLGAVVALVPAAFTAFTGAAHWHTLLRARAIESQMWVVAAGQWGEHPGNRRSYGHTMLIDPWGEIVAELPEGVGFVIADLSAERVEEVRTRLPSLRHRRFR